jgi:pyrimidine operon attenuation protein/uracil phosphoribosyltransferase
MGAYSKTDLPTDLGRNITLTLTLRVDNLSNELVVRQSPAGKKVSTEAEEIVGIRHQATTGEHTAG